jgi:hypothetical protein
MSSWDYAEELADGTADVDTDLELAQRPMMGVVKDDGSPAELVAPIIEMMPNGILVHFNPENRIYMSYMSAMMFSSALTEGAMSALTIEVVDEEEE